MTRAITSPELAKLRSDNQYSELYLAIHKPAVVFACRVNQTFTTTDDVYQLTYDGVTTGAYTAVLPGMTCYVGTSAGAYDLGICRIRKDATASVLYIGRTSEIQFADNVFLTVVNEFRLWARHWYAPAEAVVYMDQDIAYVDQNASFDPVPVLGPDAVLWLTGATVTLSPTAAASWVLGSTISAYSWSAPGASATANLTTATPTLTYNAAGTYRIACTVTAANGKSFTGYRNVFVYSAASMPVTAFNLDNCSGDHEAGGWSFSVTLFDQAALADVQDRAKVILFAKDTYNGAAGSIGPLTGYENIIAIGWIDDEGIDWDAEQGAVKFTVKGPAYWLSKLAAFPGGLKNATAAPTDWRYTQGLTIDRALHNLTHWRSTIDAVLDVTLSGDTRTASGLTVSPGTIWSQLKEIGSRILAAPTCDRYGRLFIETDSQYLLTGARTSFPVVQAITTVDWSGRVRIPRRSAGDLAQIETGGTDAAVPYFSRSYGKIPGTFGNIESKDNLLVSDQTDLNNITGMLVAQRNNAYPAVSIQLAANNRMIDIAPRQYVTLTITAGDTERGITWTAQKLIPRRVSYNHDPKTGTLVTDLEAEGETSGPAAQTVIPPQPPQTNIPPTSPFDLPDFPIVSPPGIWFPPTIPGGGGPSGTCMDVYNGPYSLGIAPNPIFAGQTGKAYFPMTIRAGMANKTTLIVSYELWQDCANGIADAFGHWGVYKLDSQGEISGTGITNSSGTSGELVWEFNGITPEVIGGFAVQVEAGGKYQPITLKSSGSFNVTSNANWSTVVSGLDPAKVYYVRSTGTWTSSTFHPDNPDYSNGGISATGGATADGTFYDTSGITAPNHNYNNIYLFPTAGGEITVSFYDAPFSDNVGTQTWALYECKPTRYVNIRSMTLYNACSA